MTKRTIASKQTVAALLVVLALSANAAGCSSENSASDATAEDATATTTAPADGGETGTAASDQDPAGDGAATLERPDGWPKSAGCDTATATSGTSTVTIEFEGGERWYDQRVPPGYDASTPTPIVFDLHGYAEGSKLHQMMSSLGDVGDAQGFITISPQGRGEPAHWLATPDSPDVELFGVILNQIEADLCVDQARVYVTGFSNGAFLTSSLVCAYAERIAAVAPIAGLREIQECEPTRPVPMLSIHGTADDFVLYEGGFGASAASLPGPAADQEPGATEGPAIVPGVVDQSIEGATSAWAYRNGCNAEPNESALADDVSFAVFECPVGADVELIRIDGGGHTWPGSELSATLEAVMGPTTMSIDASELIWEFFARHSLAVG